VVLHVFDQHVTIVPVVSAVWSSLQGDPDSENNRRQDPVTQQGILTPQGFKYKIRYFAHTMGHPLFIWPDGPSLSERIQESMDKIRVKKTNKALKPEEIQAIIRELCQTYYDVRTFGAVLTDPVNAPITGPMQVGYTLSTDPIFPESLANTRRVVTRRDDNEIQNRTMGRSCVVPFEVILPLISIDPFRAAQTGFTYGDYELLLQALTNMWNITRSTGRSGVCAEELIVFRHTSKYGNMQDMKLHRRVTVTPKDQDQSFAEIRSFDDCSVQVDEDGLAERGIHVDRIAC
jgi:CRISPR-associated protein Csd2